MTNKFVKRANWTSVPAADAICSCAESALRLALKEQVVYPSATSATAPVTALLRNAYWMVNHKFITYDFFCLK